MNRLRSETKHALPRPPPSFVIILNVILISLIVLIILCSNLSLRSTIPASFFPALFQRWKRRRLLCQKPKATWCLPGSFLPPGYSSSPKAISYSLQNLSPKHNKRRVVGEGVTLFLARLNLLRVFPPCLVRSSPLGAQHFSQKLCRVKWKIRKSTEKKTQPKPLAFIYAATISWHSS